MERYIPFGPNYDEMLNPGELDPAIRQRALKALTANEFDSTNLFNITWKDSNDQVRKLVLPPELTGVDANIVVMLGCYFPSGSHKVGAAYSMLMEGMAEGGITKENVLVAPSSGNFGIGVAYIANLLGFKAVIVMPEKVSKERYERIKKYGAEIEVLPGTKVDIVQALKKTREMAKDPKYRVLAQFELFSNYRFHRHVTGFSAVEAVTGVGNGRIAAFVAAPGSAGTMAAGDQIKVVFPEVKIAALEPYECPTLANGGRGQHRIEGIGDQMCTLVHNVLNTDFVILIKDEETIQGLKVIRDGLETLVKLGVPRRTAEGLRPLFGPSGICNVIGAIKLAKYLRLGPGDNVVTVATDGFDRYQSVVDAMQYRYLELEPFVLERWAKDIFLGARDDNIFDLRKVSAKERLFGQKEEDWLRFGYSKQLLDSLREQSFWDGQYAKVTVYNQKVTAARQSFGQN